MRSGRDIFFGYQFIANASRADLTPFLFFFICENNAAAKKDSDLMNRTAIVFSLTAS
jgi:hypothetical protein